MRGPCVGLLLVATWWRAGAKRTQAGPTVDLASLCRAVVDELVIETHKFDMLANGEDDIYDTVPAICLAVLRAYTLDAPEAGDADGASRPRKLLKLSADELDAYVEFIPVQSLAGQWACPGVGCKAPRSQGTCTSMARSCACTTPS
jgi:hypothetical protein